MEGTRPLLVEVQALTSATQNPMPRRTANGFDYNRLFLLIAVLGKRVAFAYMTRMYSSTWWAG